MTSTTRTKDLKYDSYDGEIDREPYPTYRRLREEAPLYYNEPYDFYAVSRYDDCERVLVDRDTFISGRGGILELIKAGIEMPAGTVIFEDPPSHTIHRKLMSRMFTPRKVAALEAKIREFCADALDPLVEEERIDFIADFGSKMPMRVIGMLMGIPEQEQAAFRERADAKLRTEEGLPKDYDADLLPTDMVGEYVAWREKHPSDGIITEMLSAEFEDETGNRRRLSRDELITYCTVVAGAGNETTNRLIGWAAKLLAEHPDQRHTLVDDRELIPQAIEEILRFESPGPHVARYVAKDAEFYGQTVPAGSAILSVVAAGDCDNRKFGEDAEQFDITRKSSGHLAFGYGAHFCLGVSLARIAGRIALDEILNRFTDWEIDGDSARIAPTSTVRGWETLPAFIR